MSYRVTFTCPYYLQPGETKRDTIPAGTIVEIVGTSGEWSQIAGTDPNPWRGKWVRTFYLQPVDPDTEPEPPPTPEPVEPVPYFILEDPTGSRARYALAPDGYTTSGLRRTLNIIKGIFRA